MPPVIGADGVHSRVRLQAVRGHLFQAAHSPVVWAFNIDLGLHLNQPKRTTAGCQNTAGFGSTAPNLAGVNVTKLNPDSQKLLFWEGIYLSLDSKYWLYPWQCSSKRLPDIQLGLQRRITTMWYSPFSNSWQQQHHIHINDILTRFDRVKGWVTLSFAI